MFVFEFLSRLQPYALMLIPFFTLVFHSIQDELAKDSNKLSNGITQLANIEVRHDGGRNSSVKSTLSLPNIQSKSSSPPLESTEPTIPISSTEGALAGKQQDPRPNENTSPDSSHLPSVSIPLPVKGPTEPNQQSNALFRFCIRPCRMLTCLCLF